MRDDVSLSRNLQIVETCSIARCRSPRKGATMPQPLRLSDAELDAVMSACRPLDPDLRDPFLRAAAHALQGHERPRHRRARLAPVCPARRRTQRRAPEMGAQGRRHPAGSEGGGLATPSCATGSAASAPPAP